MLIDAVVLAGGRSSRLGSVPKSGLIYREQSLLGRTLSAVAGRTRHAVVVGDVDLDDLPAWVLTSRENPPFGGPVCGIAAGMDALAAHNEKRSEYLLVLACDMPAVGAAVDSLIENAVEDGDGFIALDNDRLQPLAALYRTDVLTLALAHKRLKGDLTGLPVFRLISDLELTPVAVPPGSTDDVDTWADAERFGIRPSDNTQGEDTMTEREEEDRILADWVRQLVDALQILELDVDQKAVLGLAGKAAHTVLRPAAPLTTFVVGYAAGIAAAGGTKAESAVMKATETALQLLRDGAANSSTNQGWTSTGQ